MSSTIPESSQQPHEVEPQMWAQWITNADGQQSLIAHGQEWILTDTTIDVIQ